MNKFQNILILAISAVVVGTSISASVESIVSNGIKEHLSIEYKISEPNSRNDNDTTPPITTHSLDPPVPDGDNGFYVGNVTITLNATDDMSGVNTTYYYINGGPWNTYIEPFTVMSTRHYWINYYSIDKAGNNEDIKQVEFIIDKKPPYVHLIYQRLKKPVRYKFTAECLDYITGIDRVEFCDIHGGLLSIDYNEPYEWIWNMSPKGKGLDDNLQMLGPELGIMAVAFDRAGNSAYDLIEATCLDPFSISGIICNPMISEEEVSFLALLTISNYGGIHLFKRLTFPNNYSGYVGKFFVCAKFWP